MDIKPFFSVIIPVYNAEKYLRDCVKSVLEQSFSDFELILVDDGSIDSSANICDSFSEKDNRIRVVHKKNGGVSSARNCGLNTAFGLYMLFLDADDYIEKERLATFRSKLTGEQDEILVTGFSKFVSDTSLKYETLVFNPKSIIDDYIRSEWSVVWRLCIGKKRICDIRFNEGLQYGEDYLFSCCLLSVAKKVLYVETKNNDSYLYRTHNPSSLMRNQRLVQISDQCDATSELECYLMRHNLMTKKTGMLLNARKNWCRSLVLTQSLSLFNQKEHSVIIILKKIMMYLICHIYRESRELYRV